MSDSATAAPPENRPRFRLPSAYTILFALIVVMAIATWIIPAGAYKLDKEGAPIPGTYHEVAGDPQRILIDSLTAPINGLYGIDALMHGGDARGGIVVVGLEVAVLLLEFATVEGGHLLEPGERVLELFLGVLLLVARGDDTFLEQIALLDADLLIR